MTHMSILHSGETRFGIKHKSNMTVFFGGSIGCDPKSLKTWSGIAVFLTAALDGVELLDRAVGIDVSRLRKRILQAKAFKLNRAAWRDSYYLDPAYRNSLTHAASRIAVAS